MINKLKLFLAGLMIVPILAVGSVSAASNNPLDASCAGTDMIVGTADDIKSPACLQAQGQGSTNPVPGTIATAINIIALVAGVGAVIMVMLGSFFYVTSGGNSENVAKARARITAGLIGLAVVAVAWPVVRFVTDRLIQ